MYEKSVASLREMEELLEGMPKDASADSRVAIAVRNQVRHGYA